MSRRVLALAAVFLVLVTALWYFFLLSPRNGRISELNDQLETARTEEAALTQAVASLQDVQENDVAFLAAIGIPIVYAVVSFVGGLIYGLVINLVLGLTGGLEIEIR